MIYMIDTKKSPWEFRENHKVKIVGISVPAGAVVFAVLCFLQYLFKQLVFR